MMSNLETKGRGLESGGGGGGYRRAADSQVGPYLATQRDLYRNRDHLSQQTAVEGHHEGHGIVVRKHQRHLREGGGDTGAGSR